MVLVFFISHAVCSADPVVSFYTLGAYQGSPCYWKNKERFDLPVPAGTRDFDLNAIAVASNKTIYIAGNYRDEKTYGVKACYWQDSTRIDLPVPAGVDTSHAKAITVTENGTVYIAGYYVTGNLGDRKSNPCYWRGTTLVNLPVPIDTKLYDITAIAVSAEGTVYIGGSYMYTSDDGLWRFYRACYWKNIAIIDLPVPEKVRFSTTNAIRVAANGSVFVVGGWGPNGDLSKAKACYWQDTVRVDLPNFPNSQMGINSFFVAADGTVFWSGGSDTNTPFYWKNTTKVELPMLSGVEIADVLSIFVAEDGTIYAAGFYVKDDKVFGCFWKNRDFKDPGIVFDYNEFVKSVIIIK